MRRKVLGRITAPVRRYARLIAFLAPLALALAAVSVHAQQIPGVSPEQLMQLKQQFGQGGEAAVPNADAYGQNNPPPLVLTPAVPRESGPLQPSRLEQIMSARAGVRLKQFGYDQLGRASSVTVPQAGAVQDSYILGPSDEIVVSLRGQENSELRTTVNRNGQVVLPRLSPIPAAGRTLGDFRQDVESAVQRAYVATNAFVSLGRMRQISVLVSGEVNNPGQRLLTGLSSVVDALLISGGVRKTGSLRDIRIQRNGHEFHVDLYSVLTVGGPASDLRLADGDRILVPPLGPVAAVTGLVRQPGIYELPARSSGLSVRALLNLAGGKEVLGSFRISILHILPDGRGQLVPATGESEMVRNSEVLYVQMGADQTVSQATLSGGTGLAGNYPVVSGTKLSDILRAPGALGPAPYTPFGIIVRKDPKTMIRQLIAMTPVAVLNGREDWTLQGDDMVRPLSVNEARLLEFVLHTFLVQLYRDQNRIRSPLSAQAGSDNSLINQLTNQTSQAPEIEDLSSVPANIQRQGITALLDVPAPGSALADVRAAENQRRMDELQARQTNTPGSSPNQPYGTQGQQQPQQDGSLNNGPRGNQLNGPGAAGRGAYGLTGAYGLAGAYPGANNGLAPSPYGDRDSSMLYGGGNGQEAARNFTEQPTSPDSYASNREVQTFGQLVRQLGVDPLILINFLIDHRIRLDGAVRGPGSYFVGPNVTLKDIVDVAGGTVNWADESGVEVISTLADRASGRAATARKVLPLHRGMLADYIVQPYDQFRFSQIRTDVGVGAVTVQGEVRFPGNFQILRGEHLSDLLKRAGGLTSTAYPEGTVYLRQSAAQAEREGYSRAADEVQNQLVIAMTRIGTGKLDPNTFSSMQTFVTELRNRQALGRISVEADPRKLAANPALDPLLEAGDVIYVPPRPSTVAVLGQVLQPGNFSYRRGATVEDYINQAGGYNSTADESLTYIVYPNGEARKVGRSWLSFEVANLPPGSSIVVPRDVTPLDLRQTIIDVSQIFSQFAVSIASIAVLSKQ